MKKLISILTIFSMLCSTAISCSFAAETAKKENLLTMEEKNQTNIKSSGYRIKEKISKAAKVLLECACGVGIAYGFKFCYDYGHHEGYNEGYHEGYNDGRYYRGSYENPKQMLKQMLLQVAMIYAFGTILKLMGRCGTVLLGFLNNNDNV